jgi:hypothetical protein
MITTLTNKFLFSTLPRWATVDPYTLNAKHPHTIKNILDGRAYSSKRTAPVVDPLNGETFIHVSMAD